MGKRKIVQLAACAAENGHSLYALCDDGTVWDYQWLPWNGNPAHSWKQLAPITRATLFAATSDQETPTT